MEKTRKEYLAMRFRDLKRHLLLLGVNEIEIKKRLDKQELVDLILSYSKNKLNNNNNKIINKITNIFSYYSHINSSNISNNITTLIILIVFLLFIILFIYYFYNIFDEIFQSLFQWILLFFQYPLMKLPALKYSYRKNLFISFILLSLSILIDIYIVQIQISVVVRWFISSDSIFLAKTLSFPLQMPSNNPIGFMGGIDLGPMITIWLAKKVKEWFESKSAEIIMKYKNE